MVDLEKDETYFYKDEQVMETFINQNFPISKDYDVVRNQFFLDGSFTFYQHVFNGRSWKGRVGTGYTGIPPGISYFGSRQYNYLNDEITSIRYHYNPFNGNNIRGQLRLYEHANFQGKSISFIFPIASSTGNNTDIDCLCRYRYSRKKILER